MNDYSVKTVVRIKGDFSSPEFNALMRKDTEECITENIKSVIRNDPTLPSYIDDDCGLAFRFLSDNVVVLEYAFVCYDENEAEAESFSEYCLKDIEDELEAMGYTIESIACKAEEMYSEDESWEE